MNDLTQKEKNISLLEHLVELRSRILKIVLVWLSVVALLFPFLAQLMNYVTRPILLALPHGSKLSITGVLEGILIPLKLLLTVGFIISLPFSLFQVWAFVAPGLYKKEKRLIFALVISSLIFFCLGMVFCYFVFFPLLFKVAATFTPQQIAYYIPTISSYLSFSLTMLMVFGTAFQVPVLMLVLHRAQLVKFERLKKFRSYAIVAAFIIAGVLTPPDVVSQLLLAIPLVLLYELGLLACKLFPGPK
ncbi:MAG: twin-arginine translocase subunit TatC [Neisseriaceae bacterium]